MGEKITLGEAIEMARTRSDDVLLEVIELHLQQINDETADHPDGLIERDRRLKHYEKVVLPRMFDRVEESVDQLAAWWRIQAEGDESDGGN